MALIGLDIGTTGCKSHYFSDDLDLITSASKEYGVDIPHPKWAEQDAELVWRLAKECLKACVQKANASDRVWSIGLSVQGEAVTPVDNEGRALRPMILGMDTRTNTENKRIREDFGEKAIFELTGMPIHSINTFPKLLWLREHERQIWEKADKFLLYEDFIINKLTGRAIISKCLASRTQIYDIAKDTWSEEILQYLGIGTSQLAQLKPSGYACGSMRSDLAGELGFSKPPIISTGGHDQACSALGAGITKPGMAMVSTGTAEVVEVAIQTPHLNDTLFKGNMSVYQHTFQGLYVVMTLNQSGGFILRWFRDTFCHKEMIDASALGLDAYNLILKDVDTKPSPIMMLPHFAGSGTPTFDTLSKGAVLGLTFATTRADVAKAILDGLTMELRLNLEVLQAGGISIDVLRAIGGGAKSSLWLQLKADITGIPVAVPAVTEAAGMGAAILGGVATGVFDDPVQAINRHLTIQKVYEPDSSNKALFDERYELYKLIYPIVKGINHKL